MTRTARLCAAIFALALLSHLNSLGGVFHYDDTHSLVDNPHVRSLGQIPDYFFYPDRFSAEPAMAMYRPLVTTSYALTYALAGYAAWPYLLFNIAVHGLVSCLAFLLIAGKTRRLHLAWWAGALFAVHPLNTQVANYISSRSESLAALGVLAALYWLGKKRGLVAYGLGLLSKSMAVVGAPWALLWHGAKSRRDLWPVAALTAAYIALISANAFLARSLAQDVRPYGTQLYTQTKALVYYLYLTVFPVELSVEHPLEESYSPWDPVVWLAGSALLSLLYVAWRARGQAAGVGLWMAFAGLAVPFFVPLNVLVNEHRMYLPLFGLAYALVAALAGSRRVVIARAGWWALGGLALLTWQRNEVWQSDYHLWADAAAKAPRAFRAQSNLGLALYGRGELAAARAALEGALRLNPRYARTWNNSGLVYEELGDYAAAERAYARALQLRPDLVGAHANLGRLYLGTGRYGAAVQILDQALERDTNSVALRTNLGLAHQRAGRLDLAVREYERALAHGALNAEAYNNMGLAYQDLGQVAAAEAALQKAVALAPGHAAAAINLRQLQLRRQGRGKLEIYAALTDEFPDRPELWRGLAAEYAAAGRLAEAVAACRRVIALDPRDEQAVANLQKLLARQGAK